MPELDFLEVYHHKPVSWSGGLSSQNLSAELGFSSHSAGLETSHLKLVSCTEVLSSQSSEMDWQFIITNQFDELAI